VILTWGESADIGERLAKHQAQALEAAGYGSQHDAWADGWAAGFDDRDTDPEFTPNPYPPTEGATK